MRLALLAFVLLPALAAAQDDPLRGARVPRRQARRGARSSVVGRVPARWPDAGHGASRKIARRVPAASSSLQPIAGLPEVVATGRAACSTSCCIRASARTRSCISRTTARGHGGVGTELARGEARRPAPRERAGAVPPGSRRGRSGMHFGGRIVFDRAGYVYLTLGDRGEMQRAQRSRRPRRLGDPPARRRPRAGRQSVRRQGRAGSRRSSTSGTATSRARRCIRRPACSGPTSTGRRAATRSTSSAPARNYGWPVITYGVNYGTGTKIGEGTHKAGMAQPHPLLGAVDRAVGHGVLHRRPLPALEGRPLRRRAEATRCWCASSSTARRW